MNDGVPLAEYLALPRVIRGRFFSGEVRAAERLATTPERIRVRAAFEWGGGAGESVVATYERRPGEIDRLTMGELWVVVDERREALIWI